MTQTCLDAAVQAHVVDHLVTITQLIINVKAKLHSRFKEKKRGNRDLAKPHKAFVDEATRLFSIFKEEPLTSSKCCGLHEVQKALQMYLADENPDLARLTEAQEWEAFIGHAKRFSRSYVPVNKFMALDDL